MTYMMLRRCLGFFFLLFCCKEFWWGELSCLFENDERTCADDEKLSVFKRGLDKSSGKFLCGRD